MDDLAIYINDKITRRGIAKGLVFVQEDLNKNILEAQKNTVKVLMLSSPEEQYDCLVRAKPNNEGRSMDRYKVFDD